MEPLVGPALQPVGEEPGGAEEEELAYDGGEEGEEEDADEEMATSDEEYNLTHFGIAQALPVPDGPPDFAAGPPQTAEEYLQWVRYEASRCPRITRKDIDPAILQQQQQQEQQQEGGGAGAAQGPQGQRGGAGTGGAGPGRRRGNGFQSAAPPPVLSDCQEWARPDAKWLCVFLQDFSKLRIALAGMQRSHARELATTRLPHLDNTAAWESLCFEQWQPLEQQQGQQGQQEQGQQGQGQESGQQGQGQQGSGEEVGGSPPPPPPPPPPPDGWQQPAESGHRRGGGGGGGRGAQAGGEGGGGGGHETDRLCGPVVRTVLALDQVSVGCLLQRHVTALWGQAGLSYMRSQWLFALTAALERPVPPDVAAAMRDLVRRCSAWRAGLTQRDDPALPRLNVLLAVAGGYFGQDEGLCAAVAAAGLGDLA